MTQLQVQIKDQALSSDHILVVGHTLDEEHEGMDSYGKRLQCPMVIADSPAQAIASAQIDHPYLVILSGELIQQWSPQMVARLRQSVQPKSLVIVAITDSSELSWEVEPKDTGLDGFLVEPISPTVLNALNESAIAKHKYFQCA
ncbi:MAG: hypothetical protein AB8B99_06970 [Phormidesmis sp.]